MELTKKEEVNMNAGMVFAAFIGGFATILMMFAWGGFMVALTLSTLWGWFIVPAFGLPMLSMLQAYGVALTFFALRGANNTEKNKDSFPTVIGKAFFNPLLQCAVLLGCGWVAKSMM